MSKTKRIVLTCAVLGILVLAMALWPSNEPLHKGKPISYWVNQACTGNSSTYEDEVEVIGIPAIPYMIAKLRTKDSAWRNAVASARKKSPRWLRRRLPGFYSAEELHFGAARTLVRLGPKAKAAVPDLIRCLSEGDYVVSRVTYALNSIGPDAKDALPALRLTITNPDDLIKADAAEAIWHIGRETNIVLTVCSNVMQGTNFMGINNAALLLQEMGYAELGISAVKQFKHNHPENTQAADKILKFLNDKKVSP